ncbi:hypothetical protein FRB93_000730 [Tulasnella sp. JGI-2019a]|nr:hypothetical protein FRB93_000730 [Tulasnella sp. JGI-2019a]
MLPFDNVRAMLLQFRIQEYRILQQYHRLRVWLRDFGDDPKAADTVDGGTLVSEVELVHRAGVVYRSADGIVRTKPPSIPMGRSRTTAHQRETSPSDYKFLSSVLNRAANIARQGPTRDNNVRTLGRGTRFQPRQLSMYLTRLRPLTTCTFLF